MRIISLLTLNLLLATQLSAAPVSFSKASGKVAWTGSKEFVDGKHNGTVDLKSGTLDLAAKKGEFVIDMKTITPKDGDADSQKKLAGHLSNDDFFNAEKFPEAKIVVKDLAAEKAGSDAYNVTADVTIRDKTQELKFPATITTQKDGKVKIVSSLSFDRTKFGILYSVPEDGLVSKLSKDAKSKLIKKEVKIDLDLTSI
jgi:polyisoprenoid-binding protein YceI